MSLPLGVALAPFHLEDDDLLGPALAEDFSHDLNIGEQGLSCEDILPVGIEKNILEFNRLASLAGDFLHPNGIALRDLILFSPGPNYRVHSHPPA